MNELARVFSFQEKQVRTVAKDGYPWFVAKDVCEILEISKHRDAISRLPEFMRGVGSSGHPWEQKEYYHFK